MTWIHVRVRESCHPLEWVTLPAWMSHVTRMDMFVRDSCHTHGYMCIRESCHSYEWVMSPVWMNHVTYMTESCHAQVTLGFRRREGRETTYCKQIQKFWNKQKLKQISDIRQVEKHVTFYMGREPNYFNTLPLRMSGFSNTKSIFLCDKNESQKFWNEFL